MFGNRFAGRGLLPSLADWVAFSDGILNSPQCTRFLATRQSNLQTLDSGFSRFTPWKLYGSVTVNSFKELFFMSGHSKWSTIKHKKAAKDAKKGRIFTKLIKEITVAARTGGGDINSNPRLRTAVITARTNSMPGDNIARAIKKGTGELEGVSYEEIQYEGYGPGGAAILAQVLTDNKNRTVSEIRRLFTKHGGNLGETGCVAWMFDKKGVITLEKSQIDEDRLMGLALEAGAEDVKDEGDIFEVVTQPEDFERVKETFDREKVVLASAQITMVPKNTVTVDGKHVEQILKLTEELEDHDDVQNVAANFDIPSEYLDKAS
jgi:YebC/PmpR family DNA-binding regulatory protein